jgi:hypothetical protein
METWQKSAESVSMSADGAKPPRLGGLSVAEHQPLTVFGAFSFGFVFLNVIEHNDVKH